MYVTQYDGHDLDEIIDLITTIQINEFGVATSASEQPDLRDIRGFYQTGGGNFWLAFDNDRLIGTIALKDVGGCIGALRKMFVKKAYRGKDRGVAARLMPVLLEHARANQMKSIYLGTVDCYHAAHRFYEKMGFCEVTRDEVPDSVPLMDVDRKYYCYTL